MVLDTSIGILAIALFVIGAVLIIGVASGLKQGDFYWVVITRVGVVLRVLSLLPVFLLAVFLSLEGWPLSGGVFFMGIALLFFIKNNGRKK